MKQEVLRIENVTVCQDGITYLDNFNMHIFSGEIMGLIGRSAHGKEQLMQLLCDNITLKYGRVYYNSVMVNSYLQTSKGYNRIFLIGKGADWFLICPCLTISLYCAEDFENM